MKQHVVLSDSKDISAPRQHREFQGTLHNKVNVGVQSEVDPDDEFWWPIWLDRKVQAMPQKKKKKTFDIASFEELFSRL